MAKIRIPVEILPPPNSNGDHILQFRVISDDRNKTSAWSNLFIVKSIGQYRPLESDYVYVSASPVVTVTWDTPSIYNYSASLVSASVLHNHSQNFKRHDTDIFVKWGDEYFQYHDRVNSDTTSITVPAGETQVRIVGIVATHNIPRRKRKETDSEYNQRIDTYLSTIIDLFKIFDTGNQIVTWYN